MQGSSDTKASEDERALKRLAMQIALQLPDHEVDAGRVLDYARSYMQKLFEDRRKSEPRLNVVTIK